MQPLVVKVYKGNEDLLIATIPLMPQLGQIIGLSMDELREEVPGAIDNLYRMLHRPNPGHELQFEEH